MSSPPGWWARLRRRFRPPRRLTFTREGKIVVVLAVAIGFAAINTGNNLLYLLLGWVLSFIIASGILSERTLKKLAVERRPPPRVYACEPFLMEVAIENQKAKRASYSIEVEDLVDGAPLDKRCYFLKIPEGRTQRTSYRHTFGKRGLYVLGGYRLATKFPFALFRKSRDVDRPVEVLVYPARVQVAKPPSRAEVSGETTANRLGRRGEFFGLRERRVGDDRRDVHWKSSARSGRMLVREYEDEHAKRIAIAVDNALVKDAREALEDGLVTPAQEEAIAEVERSISVAASLCAQYIASGWTVELCARGEHVAPGAGRLHEAKLARTLALLPYADPAQEIEKSQTKDVVVVRDGLITVGGSRTASAAPKPRRAPDPEARTPEPEPRAPNPDPVREVR